MTYGFNVGHGARSIHTSTAPRNANRIGRRIALCGPSGSGKSTVARHIGEGLGLPVVELDALSHDLGRKPTPEDEFRRKVRDILDRHNGGWVCDGNHGFVLDLILPLADTVVWLKLPSRVALWRLLRRTITRAWIRDLLRSTTDRKSLRRRFLSRDSIFLWGITHLRAQSDGARELSRSLEEIPHRAEVVELHAAPEVSEFLRSLDQPHERYHQLR